MQKALPWIALSALILPTFIPVAPARASVDYAVQVSDCTTSGNLICIKSVEFKKEDEVNYQRAVLTGNQVKVDQVGNGGLRLSGVRQEYRTPGITYEGESNDKIIPTVEFFPAISVPCPISYCSPAREVIGVFVSPSSINQQWQNRLVTSPFRDDSAFCVSGTTKQLCTRDLRFDTPVNFRIQIQIPTDYVVSFIHGLASKFSYSLKPSDVSGYSLLTFGFSPIQHSGMLNSAWGKNSLGQEGGDYLVDSTALWFFGKNDMWSKSIGPCAGSGAYGVVNNAVEMFEPRWSAEDSTLNVQLRAPHVTSKNEIAKGYFGAFVSRSMAECLWKLDISKQSSAKLAVTYNDAGSSEVLTAVSSYKDDLFTLETSGFHFSSPTIKVKLETSPSAPSPSPKSTLAPKAVEVTKSIICYRGKVSKKIVGRAPKCPSGYKTK
jgi:hypothetical protein